MYKTIFNIPKREDKMRIKILKTYGNSFGNVKKHGLEWFRAAFAPLVLYTVGTVVLICFYVAAGISVDFAEIMTGQIQETQEAAQAGVLVGLGNFIYFILIAIAGFSLVLKGYRYGVLGQGGDRWWDLQLNMRFVKMFLYSILIGIFAAIYTSLTGGIIYGFHLLFESIAFDVLLGIFFLICGVYLGFRIALTFLLIAIDNVKPLRSSWHLLKGNVWRFFWLVVLIAFSLLIIIGIGTAILTLFGMMGGTLFVIASILMFVFGILMWLIYWAALSKSYALVYETVKKEKA